MFCWRYRQSRFVEIRLLADGVFPTPWGLKWIAEARGIFKSTFSQPVTAQRLRQSREMAAWLKNWLPAALAPETVTK